MRSVLAWFFPGGFILALALAVAGGYGPAGIEEGLRGNAPLFAFAVVIVFAAYFHRSRVVLFGLGLAGLRYAYMAEAGGVDGFFLLGAVFAFAAGLLAFSQDRGVFSTPGLVQLGSFGLVFGAGWLFAEVAPDDISALLATKPLPVDLGTWLEIPQSVALVLAFSLAVAVIVAALRDGPVERGWIWSLLMVGLSLHLSADPGAVNLLLVGAALTQGLHLVETSYAMAYRDDLTGLPARRALMRDIEGAGGGLYSAAMVDVDHFKRFNDRYGHDVGDQVLRMVAARLAKAPGGGKAYRYGGEEFALLYPGKKLQEALPYLRDVRRSVEDAVFTLRSWRRPRKKPVDPGAWRGAVKKKTPKRLSVTVSIGVADSSGNDTSADAVLKKADRALYRAKKAGRNRVAK